MNTPFVTHDIAGIDAERYSRGVVFKQFFLILRPM